MVNKLKETLRINMKQELFDDFISYMKNEMTGIECVYLSAVSDETSQEKSSHEFIDTYKLLAENSVVILIFAIVQWSLSEKEN